MTTTPDGPKSIMIKPDQEATAVKQLNVILNWSEELKRLVPPEEYRIDSLFLRRFRDRHGVDRVSESHSAESTWQLRDVAESPRYPRSPWYGRDAHARCDSIGGGGPASRYDLGRMEF